MRHSRTLVILSALLLGEFQHAELGAEPVYQAGQPRLGLPRADERFLVRYSGKVGYFKADQNLRRMRDVEAGMDVVANERTICRGESRIDA